MTQDKKLQFSWFVGLDPGESTGVYALYLPNSPAILSPVYWQAPPQEALTKLEDLIRKAALWQERMLIAAERYTTTDRTGKRSSQPMPLRVLGAAEQLSYQYTNVEFTLQQPADAKKFAPNALLRELYLHVLPRDVGCRDANDVNDAARHALLALVKRRASVYDAYLKSCEKHRASHNGDTCER